MMMQQPWWQSRPARRSLVWALVLLGAACSRPAKRTPADAGGAPRADERYALRGEIVAVNGDRKTLTIAHEAIAGFMPAMTMEFGAAAGDLASVKPGERIRAELVRTGDDFRLEKIWPDDPASAGRVAAAANALRQDTATRGAKAYREIGENLPIGISNRGK